MRLPLFLLLPVLLSLAWPALAMPPLHPGRPCVSPGSPDRPYGLAHYPTKGPQRLPTAGSGIGVENSVVPVIGSHRIIFLPVDFSDQPMDPLALAEWSNHIAAMYQFYYALSRYKLELVPTMASTTYRMPQSMADYGANDDVDRLITDAVNAANNDIDFSQYDSLIVVHAGIGEESDSGDNGNLIYSMYFWQETVPIVTVSESSGNVEIWGGTVLSVSEENASVFGTLCHEFGHQLSADDFYDARGTYVGSCGEWALMAFGGWGHSSDPGSLPGSAPAPMMAWNVIRFGWQEPVTITNNSGPASPLVISGYDALNYYKVWKNGNPGTEYFLLETRALVPNFSFSPVWDRATESMQEGLLIWRVREDIPDNHRDYSSGELVELMQADGFGHLNRPLSGVPWGRESGNVNRGDSGDIFPGDLGRTDFHASTSPSSNAADGSPSWVGLRDIQLVGSGTGISLQLEVYVKPILTAFDGDGQSGPLNQALPKQLQVLCADSASSPISGVTVDFAIISGSGSLSASSASSGANGLASVVLTPESIGTIQVSASSSSAQPISGASLVFTATGISGGGPTVDAANSLLSIYPETLAADGVATAEIFVMALDENGNFVPDVTVTISVSGSGNSVTPPSVVTNAEGQAVFALASNVAETKTISVTAGGVLLNKTGQVIFQSGTPTVSASLSSASASPTSVPADGSSTSTITVTVRDGSGSVMSGIEVTIRPEGGPLYGPLTTNASGVASMDFNSSTAGSIAYTIIAGGVTLDDRPTINFTRLGEPVSPTRSTVTVSPDRLPADGTSTTAITVTARDGSDNPLAGRSVSLSIGGSGNQLSPASAVTATDGSAVFQLASTVAESKTLQATVDGVLLSSQPIILFESTGVDVSASLSTITVSPATLPANGSSASSVTVTVLSSSGAPLGGVTVALDVSGSNSVSPASVNSDQDGRAVFSVVSTESGTKTVSASAGGVTLDARPTLSFTAVQRSVSADLSTVSASPATAVADGVETVTIAALIRDTTGAAYAGISVTPSVTGGGTTLSPASAVSADDGRVSFSLKATEAGTKEIILSAAGVELSNRPRVQFTAPPRTVDKDKSSVNVSPTTVYADGIQATAIRVVILDQNGDPFAGVSVQLIVSGSDNTVSPATAVSAADGGVDFSLASTRVEKKQITVNAGGVILSTRPYVDFVLQGVSAVRSTVSVNPATGIPADGVSEARVRIQLKNMDDQIIPGIVPVVNISGDTLTVTPTPLNPTDADGRSEFTVKTTRAGARQLIITASGVELQSRPSVSFIAGAAAKIRRVDATEGQSGVVGQPLNSPLKVWISDINDNPVFGQSVQFAISSFPAGASGQALVSPVTTDANGIAASVFTLGSRTGEYTCSASAGQLDGSPVRFRATAVAGSAAAIALVDGDGQSGAVFTTLPQPLRVRITDALGNPRSGVNVSWTIRSLPAGASGGLFSPGTAVSDSDGYARSNLTLGSLTGTWELEAAAAGLSGSPIRFTARSIAGPAYRLELVSGNGQSGTVGSLLPQPLVVRVTDSGGNPVAGQAVYFKVSGGSASFTQAMPVSTDSTGQASASLQLGTTAGPVYLSIQSTVSLGGSLIAGATATPGPAARVAAVSGLPLSARVGEYLALPLAVRVSDSYGNPIAAYPVSFFFRSVPSSATGQNVDTPSATTGSDGLAASRIRLGQLIGTYVLEASTPGLDGTPIRFSLTAQAGTADAGRSDFSLSIPSPLTADGMSAATVEITVRDAWDNPVAGLDPERVKVTSSLSGDRITQPVEATDANGRTWARIAATRSGSRQLGAVVEGITLARVETLVFSPGPPDRDASSIQADPQGNIEIINGNVLLTITLLDRFYNPVPGVDASRIAIVVGGSGNTLTPATGMSSAEGKLYASLKSSDAGFKLVQVSVDGQELTQTRTLLFVTRAVDTARSSFLWHAGSQVPANGSSAYTMRLRVRDVDGLPVEGVPISAIEVKAVESGANLAGIARTPTDANGETLIDVRSTSSGNLTCHAWVSGLKIEQSAVLNFVAGSASQIAVSGSSELSAVAGGRPDRPFVVRVSDAFGNPVAGVAVTLAVNGRPSGATGGSIDPATAITDAEGLASGLFTAGDRIGLWTVSASAEGLTGSPLEFRCLVRAGDLAAFRVTLATVGSLSGRTYNGVEIQALDAWGNAKTDYLGSIWFESSDPLAILPWNSQRRYAFTAADTGRHIFDGFVFLQTGSVTLRVTDGTIVQAAPTISVLASAGSENAFEMAAFSLPGDPCGVFVALKPGLALESIPSLRLQTTVGSVLELTPAAHGDRWYAVGRSSERASGGRVLVIGRRAGTLDYVSAETVVE